MCFGLELPLKMGYIVKIVNYYCFQLELRWLKVEHSGTTQHLDWIRMWQSLSRLSLLKFVYDPNSFTPNSKWRPLM